MEKKLKLKNKLSLFAILLICITIVAALGNILIMSHTLDYSQSIDELEKRRAYCEATIMDFMNASDYLTNEVWLYAVDKNPEHMKNFWREVIDNQNRDKALQKLLHENLSEQELVHAMRAKAYSDNLISGETWCQRLISETCDVKSEDMNERVRALKLNKEEMQLTNTEKTERVRSYLLGNPYSSAKQNIRNMVQSFQTDLSTRMNDEVHDALEVNHIARTYGIIFSIVLMALMIMATFIYSYVVKKKNLQLSEALQKAESASDAKTYFTARMSHEIRTPLNAVLGYLTIAKSEQKEDTKNEYLDKCKIAAKNLLNIVNDVLDLSAIENRRIKFVHMSFSISEMIRTIEIIYSKQAETKNINFTVVTNKIQYDMIMGDVQRVTQIITNLVSNAIKFTPEGGKVVITVEQQIVSTDSKKVMTQYIVEDTGIGITKEFLKRIFEPYEQADSTIFYNYGGTGLGLSIVKNMVEMMNGSVSLTSEVGKGSTFIVKLPNMISTDLQKGKNASIDTNEQTLDLTGINVLLAEDNEMNREIAVNFLQNLGASVTVAKDGLECAEIFEHSTPATFDVILMDIMMPRMNGYESAKRIRSCAHSQAQEIPIIAMTANAFSSDVQQALDAGMNAHVAKPFDVKTMVGTVKKYVHH